jgi:hypothetical protein
VNWDDDSSQTWRVTIDRVQFGEIMTKKEHKPNIASAREESAEITEQEDTKWLRQEEEEIEKRMRPIAQEILRNGRFELDRLEKAGVDRSLMVKMLASCASGDRENDWAEQIRRRRKTLLGISERIDTLAKEAEKCAKDPFFFAQAWAVMVAFGGSFGLNFPNPLWDSPGVPMVIEGMQILSKGWKRQADQLGLFLKKYSDVQMNLGIPMVLCRICIFLKSSEPEHWDDLARLFTYAFEACKKERSFSADSLRNTWKKHGKKMLRGLISLSKVPSTS